MLDNCKKIQWTTNDLPSKQSWHSFNAVIPVSLLKVVAGQASGLPVPAKDREKKYVKF